MIVFLCAFVPLYELTAFAEKSKDPTKAICIEALEFASRKGRPLWTCYLQAVPRRKPGFLQTILYIYTMKSTAKKDHKISALREQILKSLIASFKIEGIDIPLNVAEQTLKKVELKLGK